MGIGGPSEKRQAAVGKLLWGVQIPPTNINPCESTKEINMKEFRTLDIDFGRGTAIGLLRSAYRIAESSPDLSTKNGALLVDRYGKVLSEGVNEPMMGVSITDDRLKKRPDKYFYTEHAERNVLYNALQNGVTDFSDTTMICPWYACSDCARAIIGFGVKNVIGHQQALNIDAVVNEESQRINWDDTIKAAWNMFDEVGVKYIYIDTIIGGVENLHSGKIWNP